MKDFLKRLEKLNLFLVIKEGNLVLKGKKGKLDQKEIESIKKDKYINDFIKSNKQSLIKYLMDQKSTDNSNVSAIYPLTPMQEGMFFHWIFDKESSAYVDQFTFELHGELNVSAIERSWDQIIKNHTILRSGFFNNELSIPFQCVYNVVDLPFKRIDYSQLSETERQKRVSDFLDQDRREGFDLTVAPLMKLTIVKMKEHVHHLVWTYHHILLDGWSLPILFNELLAYYNQLDQGVEVLEGSEDRFEDYVNFIASKNPYAQEKFWKQYMSGFKETTLLPFVKDHSLRNKGIGSYAEKNIKIDDRNFEEIRNYSQQHHITINTLVQGVWALLLSRYANSSDVLYGVTVSGRPPGLERFEKSVGLFINTLPLRAKVKEDDPVIQWLKDLQLQHTEAREYQYNSLSDIQKWSKIKGDLFDSILVFENYPVGTNDKTASRDSALTLGQLITSESTNYPLTIVVTLTDELAFKFSYNEDLIDEGLIDLISQNIRTLLLDVLESPKKCLGELTFVSPVEKQLLKSFNQTTFSKESNGSVVHLFEKSVSSHPDREALTFGTSTYTYAQLNEWSNQLAHYLHDQGLGHQESVGVMMERSEWSVMAMIGIMKLGCIYVPIDQTFPQTRIDTIIDNSGLKGLIINEAPENETPSTLDVPRLNLASGSVLNGYPKTNLNESFKEDDSSYMIYTSGSTGIPKGVEQTHKMLFNLITWDLARSGLRTKQRHLQYSSFSFDSSLHDIFYCLSAGGQVFIVSEKARKDVWELKSFVVENKIETLSMPYSALKVLFDAVSVNEFGDHSINEIISTGEQLYISGGLRSFLESNPGTKVHNFYGPSETHVVSSAQYEFDKGNIPVKASIGRPIDNTQFYILDKEKRQSPIGAIGELYISGDNLAKGYHNLTGETNKRFTVDHNINSLKAKSILYKTGDLCEWNIDGSLTYLGRIDQQVKVRGYRIELGEVENALQKMDQISQCAVLTLKDKPDVLVGYIVCLDESLSREYLCNQLRLLIPEYMIPTQWVRLERLPLTVNGKVDKEALPALGPLEQENNILPSKAIEKKMAEIWSDILNIPLSDIGIHSNFFDLGGHSLLAMRIISKMRKQLKISLELKELFAMPTIHQLSKHSSEKSGADREVSTLVRQKRPEKIPLSFSQERLWFIDKLQGSQHYHIPLAMKLVGHLEADSLRSALVQVVNRHEILRTVYKEKDGIGYQEVMAEGKWDITYDTNPVNKSLSENEIQQRIDKEIQRPFDLSLDHPIRASLLRLNETSHLLILVIHHIATDGWSQPLFVNEVTEWYEAEVLGRPHALQHLNIQYADFAIWQRSRDEDRLVEEKLNFWEDYLKGAKQMDIPTDFARPSIQGTSGDVITFEIQKDLANDLKAFSKHHRVTLFMTLLSAFKVLLYRYSGIEDVSVGSPVVGRNGHEVESLIGFFVNTVVFRTDLSGGPSFLDLLKKVRETAMEALEYQHVPFEKIVDRVEKSRDLSRSPLFQVAFGLNNNQEVNKTLTHNLKISSYAIKHETAEFDLDFNVDEIESGLRLTVVYCTELFTKETILRLIKNYEQVLTSAVENPQKLIDKIDILATNESQLLHEFGSSEKIELKDDTILSLIRAQEETDPDATAVVFGKETISYKELEVRSNQLANYIKSGGIKLGGLIGIHLDRSIEMIVGILGILKSGSAYVPIDTANPETRVSEILKHSNLQAVLSSKKYENRLSVLPKESVILLDTSQAAISQEPITRPEVSLGAESLAYVIYTSGTSGNPKGVMIRHRSLVNLCEAMQKEYDIDPSDNFLQFASIGFDMSVEEIFPSLVSGATVILPTPDMMTGFDLFCNFCAIHNITLLNLPPLFVNGLLQTKETLPASVRLLSVGGDVFALPDAIEFMTRYPNVEVYNAYGPTENTVNTTIKKLDMPEGRSVAIGKPIQNVSAFVLDAGNNRVPIGVPGELCVAGVGLSGGFINQPELTNKCFTVSDLVRGSEEKLIYRTGDLARWLPDGNLEYLGRVDDQIKIRGYRIELGEIENKLLQMKHIHSCAVVTHGQGEEKFICAYVVASKPFNKNEAIEYMTAAVPVYMIPSAWIEVTHIPLTKNGKLDTESLPIPTFDSEIEHVPPKTTTEKALVCIWSDILKTDQSRIGMYSDFFELGGHSLRVVVLASRIMDSFNVSVPIGDVFVHSTVNKLSCLIDLLTGKNLENENRIARETIKI